MTPDQEKTGYRRDSSVGFKHAEDFTDEFTFPESDELLYRDVEEALSELDVIKFRSQLKNIAKNMKSSEPGNTLPGEVRFGLPEEVVQEQNLVIDEQALELGNNLQKLHIQNHEVASREVVHELYREVEPVEEVDNDHLSAEDEFMFSEIEEAICEKDIIDLRANLRAIAGSVAPHEFSFEEIEDFIDGELSDELVAQFEDELNENQSLRFEVNLHNEVEDALGEHDVMQLRASLKDMMSTNASHTRSVEEIDSYLNEELEAYLVSEFESELIENPGLAHDLSLHKEIDEAVSEADIMALRNKLNEIAEEVRQKPVEKRGVSSPGRKVLWYAAASVALLFAVSSLLRTESYTTDQLYTQYYHAETGITSVVRSANGDQSIIEEAQYLIESKKYSEAIKILQSSRPEQGDTYGYDYYLGMALQESGDYKEAVHYYDSVIKHGDNLLVEQSEWMKCLCYLGNDDKSQAISQLKAIIRRGGYYAQNARELLDKLN